MLECLLALHICHLLLLIDLVALYNVLTIKERWNPLPYKLVLHGTTQPLVLEHSGTDIIKIFNTFEEASAMKDQLNAITFNNVQWEVVSLSAEKNRDTSSEEVEEAYKS